MERWTERQLLVTLAWMNEQWNIPDRHDWYLMQLDTTVRGLVSRKVDIRKAKLRFRNDQPKERAEHTRTVAEMAADVGKSLAIAKAQAPVTIRRISRDGTRILSEVVLDPKTGVETRTL